MLEPTVLVLRIGIPRVMKSGERRTEAELGGGMF